MLSILILVYMFKCCTQLNNEIQPSDQIKPCRIHGKPILFVCLNYQTCLEKSLFCTDCSSQHKGHTWQTVKQFFTGEVKSLIMDKAKQDEERIQNVLDRTLDNYLKSKARIQLRLIQLQNALRQYFQELKEKYPPIAGPNFREDSLIDNEKMSSILQFIRQKQINEWIDQFQQDVGTLINPIQEYTICEINDIEILINNKQWDNQFQRNKNFKSFIQKHFPVKEKDDPFYYRFSQADKNVDIKLSNHDLEAIYHDDTYENIKKPVVLATRKMNPKNNRVSFHIKNISKTVIVFDSSIVGIGVCIPNNARQFNFMNLHKHSHGAYMMSSNGKVYHSKLPQYINSNKGFSFGKGDIVDMWVDFNEKILHFERKGLFWHKFQMQLALNDKYMSKLRPFVLFQGQQGAIIEILSTSKDHTKKSNIKQSKIKSTKLTSCTSSL